MTLHTYDTYHTIIRRVVGVPVKFSMGARIKTNEASAKIKTVGLWSSDLVTDLLYEMKY